MQNIFTILEDRKSELNGEAHYFAARDRERGRSKQDSQSLHDVVVSRVALYNCYEKVLDDLKANWDQLYPGVVPE